MTCQGVFENFSKNFFGGVRASFSVVKNLRLGGYPLSFFLFYNGVIKRKGGFLLNRADLKKIKAEYLSGGITLQDLAEKYDIPYSTLTKKCSEGKWKELRKENGKKTEKKIAELTIEKDVRRAMSVISVADKLLDKITELVDNVPMTAQSVKQITSALKDIKEIKGEKSAEDRREQMARIKKLEKEIEAEAKDATVIVQFEEDITKWNK